jgi:GTP-binding protein
MTHMTHLDNGRVHITFSVPSRALIGYRDEFLTDTRGTGIMNTSYAGYEAYRGDFPDRFSGSLVSDRQGRPLPLPCSTWKPGAGCLSGPGIRFMKV